MSTSLDLDSIKVVHQESPIVVAQNHDNCDPWDNTGHDGGPNAPGGDDFDSWNCG